MANLPDINTADVGIIAFWNAEDHKTAGVVDPLDCTGVFDSYDVYDNGLDGVIALGSGRNFNCRMKNDGWCVAWIDRTNTFFYPDKGAADFGESGYKGYYDILWNWVLSTGNISSTLTTLSYIISLFEAALETSGDFTFAAADVGHYCYEFPAANVLSLIGAHAAPGAQTGYVQYTSGTTIYYSSIAASCYVYYHAYIRFASNTLVNKAVGGHYYATADIKAENWIPDPLTNYALELDAANHGSSVGSILILWS